MRNIVIFAALSVLLMACGTEGVNPIEFRVKICPAAISGGDAAAAATGATNLECDLETEGVTVLRGQVNPTRAYHSDGKDSPRDEYDDVALWNEHGNRIRVYLWRNAINLSCFPNREYLDLDGGAQDYHPETCRILEDDQIMVKVEVFRAGSGFEVIARSEIQLIQINDRK